MTGATRPHGARTARRRGEPWQALAACIDADPDLFFPRGRDQAGPAIHICADCPVIAECAAYARRNHLDHGVWGGRLLDPPRHLRPT